MNLELDLFPAAYQQAQTAAHLAQAIAQQKHYWEICWGWTPQVGAPASFDCVCATDTTGQSHYVYMASAIIRELTATECLLEYVETLAGDPTASSPPSPSSSSSPATGTTRPRPNRASTSRPSPCGWIRRPPSCGWPA